MSDIFVVDASVGFAWVYPSQATVESDRLLSDIAQGAVVIVPPLWFLEIANGLLAAQRRRLLSANERRDALERLLALNLTVDEVTARSSCRPTSELAAEFGLSIYDSVYLETARRRRIPLATRDRAIRKAAARCGVNLRY